MTILIKTSAKDKAQTISMSTTQCAGEGFECTPKTLCQEILELISLVAKQVMTAPVKTCVGLWKLRKAAQEHRTRLLQ